MLGIISIVQTSEVTKLTSVVDALPHKPQAILTDKGFASKANKAWLGQHKIEGCIQHKASKGRPLHPLYKPLKNLVGKRRYKIEKGFDTIKHRFDLSRVGISQQLKYKHKYVGLHWA